MELHTPQAAAVLAQTLERPRCEPYRVPNGQTELGWYFVRCLRAQGLPVPEIRRALLECYRIRLTDRRIRTLVSDLDPPKIAA